MCQRCYLKPFIAQRKGYPVPSPSPGDRPQSFLREVAGRRFCPYRVRFSVNENWICLHFLFARHTVVDSIIIFSIGLRTVTILLGKTRRSLTSITKRCKCVGGDQWCSRPPSTRGEPRLQREYIRIQICSLHLRPHKAGAVGLDSS